MKRWVIFLVIGLLVGFPISLGGTQGQGGEDLHINGAPAGPEQQEAVGAGGPEAPAVTTAWVRRYDGPGGDDEANAIAVDGQGNVFVTGGSWGGSIGNDYATIKYDTDGNRKWVRRYNGPGNSDDWTNAIAVDSQGNVYVTGYSLGSGTGFDYATIKYSP